MYLARLRIGRNGRIRLSVDQILHHRFRLALTDTADLDRSGTDYLRVHPGKIRYNALLKHRFQLSGRPRKQYQSSAVRLNHHAGRCAIPILQNDTVLREHSLLPVIVRWFYTFFTEIAFDRRL